jgi:hypothetical protein
VNAAAAEPAMLRRSAGRVCSGEAARGSIGSVS